MSISPLRGIRSDGLVDMWQVESIPGVERGRKQSYRKYLRVERAHIQIYIYNVKYIYNVQFTIHEYKNTFTYFIMRTEKVLMQIGPRVEHISLGRGRRVQ